MDQLIEWGFRLVIVGIGVWAVKGYITERTKRQKSGDQLITLCELKKQCKEQKENILSEVEGDMEHVKELIQKDLDQGQERFRELGNIQKETTKALTNLTTEIRLLQQASNGKNATAPSPV